MTLLERRWETRPRWALINAKARATDVSLVNWLDWRQQGANKPRLIPSITTKILCTSDEKSAAKKHKKHKKRKDHWNRGKPLG